MRVHFNKYLNNKKKGKINKFSCFYMIAIRINLLDRINRNVQCYFCNLAKRNNSMIKASHILFWRRFGFSINFNLEF